MASIKFMREKSIKYRGIWNVYIDGTLKGPLANGDIIEIFVAEGQHTFTLGLPKYQIDPLDFDINKDEVVKYRCYYPSVFAHMINLTDKWCPGAYPTVVRVKDKR